MMLKGTIVSASTFHNTCQIFRKSGFVIGSPHALEIFFIDTIAETITGETESRTNKHLGLWFWKKGFF